MSDVEDPAALFRAALEEHARGMTDDEFRLFVAKTRPPDFNQRDPADRRRNIMASIAAKQSKRPRVDHNGYPLPPEKGSQ
jgi:hypothetical protein